MTTPLRTVFINHGGGPCFFMPDGAMGPPGAWNSMASHLKALVPSVCPKKPAAVLVISAHWETEEPTVLSSANPPLLYDYYGFPPETYELKWPAPGDPALAARVRELLEAGGFKTGEDAKRGFDHGVFIPLKLSFPDADVPTVQLSLVVGLDPEKHLAMGRALAPLRGENVLIIGSGQSFHNMSGFFGGGFEEPAREFDRWLNETCVGVEPRQRSERLRNWTAAPSARAVHPREEHLAPLFVAAGAAEDEPGERVFADDVLNLAMSGFAFGATSECVAP